MARRKNSLTRFLEDIIDDTKDLVDDLVDRAKDVEDDVRDAAKNVVDDDEESSSSKGEYAQMQAALEELTTKVNQLAELQLAKA